MCLDEWSLRRSQHTVVSPGDLIGIWAGGGLPCSVQEPGIEQNIFWRWAVAVL